jgi:hypothetical protein
LRRRGCSSDYRGKHRKKKENTNLEIKERNEMRESTVWADTTVSDLDTKDWRGQTIHLKNVPAIKNVKTGKIGFDPLQLTLAQMVQIAKDFGIEPRDIPLLLTLYAKPPPHFKEGNLYARYHLNKTLFYIWKTLEKKGIGNAFPRDDFGAARAGPVPKNLKDDTRRLQQAGLLKVESHQWGEGPNKTSILTKLTDEGLALSTKLAERVGEPFVSTITEQKQELFILSPETIKERVHRDFPEYRKTYTELDTE